MDLLHIGPLAMSKSMHAVDASAKAARWIFASASAYGFLTLLPMLLLEPLIAARNPPALTHVEFFYGFLGLALAFQLLFALIAWRPRHLLHAMPAAVAEKFVYTLIIGSLMALHRVTGWATVAFAGIDLLLGCLFLVSYLALRKSAARSPRSTGGAGASRTGPTRRFLVLTRRTERFDPAVLPAHNAFLAELRQSGRLLDAGGFTDKSGGAYLIGADSMDEAQAMAHKDPLHTKGASELTLREWLSIPVVSDKC